MLGPVVLILGIASVAGLCAFLIEYDQALRRFPRPEARRSGLRTGAVAAAFFAALGLVLVLVLVR